MTEPAAPTAPPAPPSLPRRCWELVARVWGNRFVRFGFKLCLAVGILVALIATKQLDLSRITSGQVSWPWVLLCAVGTFPCFPVVALRYWLILKALEMPCSYRQSFRWTMIGAFFDVATPSATGGDLVKAVYVIRAYGPGRRAVAAASVMLDRAVGLFGLFFFAFVASLVGWHMLPQGDDFRRLTVVLAFICLGGVAGFWLFASRRMEESRLRQRLMHALPYGKRFEKAYVALAGLRRSPGILFAILGLSACNHLMICLGLMALARGLGMENFDPWQGLVILPIAVFTNTFGFAGGFGLGTAGFGFLLLTYMGVRNGATLGLLSQVIGVFQRLVGLPFYLIEGKAPPEIVALAVEEEPAGNANS